MENINRFIEQTNLRPTIIAEDIDVLIRQADKHGFFGICVPPFWVKKANREIGAKSIQLISVVGFPLGYQMTETKLEEIRRALADGVDELDVVMNISAFKAGLPWTKIEIAKCCNLVHDHYKLTKVIIETSYLSSEEIAIACRLCADAGADFIKTSSGFSGGGANIEDISLMRKVLPSHVGIKASGGIQTYDQALGFIKAGADRIGTSSGVAIVS